MPVDSSKIKPANDNWQLIKRDYNTSDIVRVTEQVAKTGRDDVALFAKQFAPNMQGLRALYNYVLNRFEYEADPQKNQWVQSPSYLNESRKGDCKSFTVFITSCLYHMGLSSNRKYVGYISRQYKHVYPQAILPDGRVITLDVVYQKESSKGGFNIEKKPFKKSKIVKVQAPRGNGLYAVSGIGNTEAPTPTQALADMEAIAKMMQGVSDDIITDGVGDITKMTSGELDRHIEAERLKVYAGKASGKVANQIAMAAKALEAGSVPSVGASGNLFMNQVSQFMRNTSADTKAAFQPFTVPVSLQLSEDDEIAGRAERKAKREARKAARKRKKGNRSTKKQAPKKDRKVIAKIGNTFKKVYAKFINHFFKVTGIVIAPWFIFIFAAKKLNREGERRKRAQMKVFKFIAKVARIPEDKLKKLFALGIKKKTGYEAGQLLDAATGSKIGVIPAALAAAIPVIMAVLPVLEKVMLTITKVFKKDKAEAGKVNNDDSSDLRVLEDMPSTSAPSGGNPQGDMSTKGSGSAGKTALPIAAGFALLLKFGGVI